MDFIGLLRHLIDYNYRKCKFYVPSFSIVVTILTHVYDYFAMVANLKNLVHNDKLGINEKIIGKY